MLQRRPGTMDDEAEIRALLDAFTQALRNKDAAAAIAGLADDAVVFDLAPPLRMGPDMARDPAGFEEWFATWESGIASEAHDLKIVVGGDVAYAYALQQMTGTKTDGAEVDVWFRATACFRRNRGSWQITHMHNSVPFAMDGSDRALLDLEP